MPRTSALRRIPDGLALVLLAFTFCVCAAQPPAISAPRTPAATIPALFLSDIHFDPMHDPAKVRELNAAPVERWAAILGRPDSPTQAADYAAIQKVCPVTPLFDPSNRLWQSALAAIRAQAAHIQFATVSGDLIAHQFDCRFKEILPSGTHADLLNFEEKTIRYVVSGLRASLPGVPLYIALGNNDTSCPDYRLGAGPSSPDQFLARTAPILAGALPASLSAEDRAAALATLTSNGSYSVPLAAVPNTRLIVLDDLYLSGHYLTCSGQPDPAPGVAEMAWLTAQLDAARQNHQHVWVLGHIPPVVDLVTTVKRGLRGNPCDPRGVALYLRPDPDLATLLAANSDIVSLALFGHLHIDEFHLFASTSAPPSSGVPVKIVGSITALEGQRPTFTLAKIDPTTTQLKDYTVIMASNLTGVAATWAPEYSYSTTYRQSAFDAPALSTLISGFQADPAAASAASQSYLRNVYAGDAGTLVRLVWPQYTCAMDHVSQATFSACLCTASTVH